MFYLFTITLLGFVINFGANGIPDLELEALRVFFDWTNGSDWRRNTGWSDFLNQSSPISDPCQDFWFGISCVTLENETYVNSISLPDNNLFSTQFPGFILSNLTKLESLNLKTTIIKFGSFQNIIGGDISDICYLNPGIRIVSLSNNKIGGSFPSCLGQTLIHIVVIDFSHNSISGTTPESMCSLENLETLNLAGNPISGTLPDCIGNCRNIKEINYSNDVINGAKHGSELVGSFPRSLCNLTQLERMKFQFTNISSSLPDCLGINQPKLMMFLAEGNHIQGYLPESLCKAPKLAEINLFWNSMTGTIPTCFGQLTTLLNVQLYHNQLTGSLPSQLCQLHELTNLGVSENLLQSTLPDCIGGLTKLRGLLMFDNHFSGTLPKTVCDISGLMDLDLNGNRFSGSLHPCLGGLKHLVALSVDSNLFSGTIPSSLCDLHQLNTLSLYDNVFTGQIHECLGSSLPVLTWFSVMSNSLSGTLPNSLCQLSYLNILLLSRNGFSGTLPSCMGQLSQLTYLYSYDTGLSGVIPDSFCDLHALKYIEIQSNQFSGLPYCFSYSFPQLETLQLQDNMFRGNLPSLWHLPKLKVLVLSNNKRLKGPLPPSLFHQQGNVTNAQSNHKLQYVVLEGTHISGFIPSSVCDAVNLKTLLLSGNLLSGNIPNCVGLSLNSLETFRVPDNRISGKFMSNLENMSSLAYLDLSNNHITGTVPASLGDISPQLVETKLTLNHLSCDLPPSVLQWQKSPDFEKFDILEGNVFSCPDHGFFGLSMFSKKSKGLVSANRESALYYSCGGASYILPVGLALFTICSLILLYGICGWTNFNGFSENDKTNSFILNHKIFEIESLRRAYLELKLVADSIICVGVFSCFFVLPLVIFSRSPYECQYPAYITMANKKGRNTLFSMGIGFSIGVSLSIGCFLWWNRLFSNGVITKRREQFSYDTENRYSTLGYMSYSDGDSFVDPLRKLIYVDSYSADPSCDGSADKGNGERQVEDHYYPDSLMLNSSLSTTNCFPIAGVDQATADHTSVVNNLDISAVNIEKNGDGLCIQIAKLLALISSVTLIAIGPNVLYVLVTIGEYNYVTKLLCTFTITIAKIILSAATIPKVSEWIAVIVFPNASSDYQYRLVIIIAISLAGFGLILTPILTVALTDSRCLYQPRHKITNQAAFEVCSILLAFRGRSVCVENTLRHAESSYTPAFDYDGDICVSAVLSTYAPVFLSFILLSAPLAAALDLIAVPILAPWCYQHRFNSKIARYLLIVLKTLSWNVPTILIENYSTAHDFNEVNVGVDIDRSAQRVLKRAFVQFASTLLVALTFGIAAPLIGISSVFAAYVQFKHHTLIFSQIVDFGELLPVAKIPNIAQCNRFPPVSGFAIVFISLIFWGAATIYYMDPILLSISLFSGFVLVLGTYFMYKRCGIECEIPLNRE